MHFSLAASACATAKIESMVQVALSAIDFNLFTISSNLVLLTLQGGLLHWDVVGALGVEGGAVDEERVVLGTFVVALVLEEAFD